MNSTIKVQIKDAVSILKLEKHAMEKVASRETASFFGFLFLLVPPVVSWLLSSLFSPANFTSVIFSSMYFWHTFVPTFALIGVIYLMSYIAKTFFAGSGDYKGFFRIVSYSSFCVWILLIPSLLSFIGIDFYALFSILWVLFMLWIFVVSFHALIYHHKLKEEYAIYTIVAGLIGYLLFKFFIGRLLVGIHYRMWY